MLKDKPNYPIYPRESAAGFAKTKRSNCFNGYPVQIKNLLEDIVKLLGANVPCVLAFELTKEREKFYRGNAGNILSHVEKENLKGEFVLILDTIKNLSF